MTLQSLTVTVVLCTYTEHRWDDIVGAIESLRAQTLPPVQIIIVVDHNAALRDRLAKHSPDLKIIDSIEKPGLAGARNSGVAIATGDVVAFLDDDAFAAPDWLEQMLGAYVDAEVLGVGGHVEPAWEAKSARSLPTEFWWVVGCSYRGLPQTRAVIRNPIGAGMSVRRDILDLIGGFSTDLGRVLKHPAGCEETELCIRAAAAVDGGRFLHEPKAVVYHRVPAERASWAYFRARCLAEGRSKAVVAVLAGAGPALASERTYVAKVLPQGFLRALGEAARGDLMGLARATRIPSGLAITTAGYVTGRLTATQRSRRSARHQQPAVLAFNNGGIVSTRTDALAAGAAQQISVPAREEQATTEAIPLAAQGKGLVGPRRWLEFDIHGWVRIAVAADAPTADQLRGMLAAFRVEPLQQSGPAEADIVVTGTIEPVPGLSWAEGEIGYTDNVVLLPHAGVQVIRDGKRWLVQGPGELLTTVLPILDLVVVDKGLAMVHSATVEVDGIGVLMPAAGGTGKTSTIAKLMKLSSTAFMGDDWAFVSSGGEVYSYAKPMFIKPHHRPIYPHLFIGARKPLIPKALSRPIGRFTTVVHPIFAKRPKLAAWSRRWSPEHRMVMPEQALGGKRIGTHVPLRVSAYVERWDGDEVVVEGRDRAWMVARIAGNWHWEMARHSRDVLAALGASGVVPLDEIFRRKAAVIEDALGQSSTLLVKVPEAMSADQASDAIVERLLIAVEEVFDQTRVPI